MINEIIEAAFNGFEVDGQAIPVVFLRYEGKSPVYVTYQQTDAENAFSSDDELSNYVDFYDFDIYSKQNYFKILEAIKSKLKDNGFRWQPTRSSGDLYEPDTGYFHKTLCFTIERSN